MLDLRPDSSKSQMISTDDEHVEFVQRLRKLYGGPKSAAQIRDRRLRHLAALIEAAPDDWRTIQTGIKNTGLSPAYLSVRFKEEAAMPMRSFALWLKFERATMLVLSGMSARDASNEAGFADQSHLGRAARRFARKSFGKVVSELRSDGEVLPAPAHVRSNELLHRLLAAS